MPRASRNPSATASATLMTLSLAICLGAAVETSAAAHRAAEPMPRSALTANQRQALASLLAQLADAARDLHRATLHSPIAAVTPRPVPAAPPLRLHVSLGVNRPHSLPTPPLRPALLNLPPPLAA